MSRAIIIARVSTEEQREANNSLPAQVNRLKSYCERKGYEIKKTFSFDESAYKTKRNEFDEILDEILQEENVVICFDKVDRLSRNVFDKRVSELYDRAVEGKVELHFPSEGQVIDKNISATQKFQFSISLGLAKYYSDAISDNVKRAREQMLYSGLWPGKAPYGYANYDRDNGIKWIKPDPFESQVVERMFNLYGTGAYSMNEIRDEVLKTFNVKMSKGKVDHILKNKFHCGTMTSNEKEYPHNYDRIISQELFNKVQEIKAGYAKKKFKYSGLPFYYRGLLRCADCGCTITPERKVKSKTGKTYHYYHCTQYNGKHGAEWVRETEITKQLSQAFNSIKVPEDVLEKIVETLRENHKQKSSFRNTFIKKLQKEHQMYQNRIENMYEDKLDGSITRDEYENRLKKYQIKQNEINQQLNKVQVADEEYYLNSEYILKLASKASELFECSEIKERRQLLKLTLQNLVLDGKKVRFDWVKPFGAIALHTDRQAWLPD